MSRATGSQCCSERIIKAARAFHSRRRISIKAVKKNRAAVHSAVSVVVVETTTKQLVEYILHKVRNQNRHWGCSGFLPLLFCTFVLSRSNSVGCVVSFQWIEENLTVILTWPSSPTPSNVHWYIRKHTHCTRTREWQRVHLYRLPPGLFLFVFFVFFEAHPTVALGGVSGRRSHRPGGFVPWCKSPSLRN